MSATVTKGFQMSTRRLEVNMLLLSKKKAIIFLWEMPFQKAVLVYSRPLVLVVFLSLASPQNTYRNHHPAPQKSEPEREGWVLLTGESA